VLHKDYYRTGSAGGKKSLVLSLKGLDFDFELFFSCETVASRNGVSAEAEESPLLKPLPVNDE
jgi:hypothetical protein